MAIPETANLLAGFVLAHAAWSISDLPEGDFLVPLAIVETEAGRKLTRFEAETQEKAIDAGKAFVSEQQPTASAWALAREGQINTSTGKIDVLVVEAWGKGMNEPITYIQPFQPFASGTFKILGPAAPVVSGSILSPEQSEPLLDALYRGVSTHDQAASLWASWQ